MESCCKFCFKNNTIFPHIELCCVNILQTNWIMYHWRRQVMWHPTALSLCMFHHQMPLPTLSLWSWICSREWCRNGNASKPSCSNLGAPVLGYMDVVWCSALTVLTSYQSAVLVGHLMNELLDRLQVRHFQTVFSSHLYCGDIAKKGMVVDVEC